MRKRIPLAIIYDFDGTLALGNMQERDFIPAVGTNTDAFWKEVSELKFNTMNTEKN
ncbi:MAG: haloacid dehalogenase-like hydrolase [Anaerophaga sp.]|nr:haloacid dehalogenase-like hydrolase [Anaerophaga sp.]